MLSLQPSPPDPEPALVSSTKVIAGARDVVWAALYERHFDDVYRLVRRSGVAAADLEDVTQRVFLRVHKLLGQTAELLHPLAWLRAITTRVVSEHHRYWRLRHAKRALVELTSQLWAGSPSPEEHAGANEQQERVASVIARMSPKLRDVLVLCELEGIDASEVATILNIPKNTVRSRRQLARDQFSRLWSRRHGGAS